MTYEEYRGCENLVYAKITEDSTENLTYGEVKELAGLGEVSKTTNTSSDTHYYDNNPAIVIMATGDDDLTPVSYTHLSKQGMFDEFDYEMKTEIVDYIVNEFKELTYKTLHEICVNYRDIDVKCDIYEFMKLREVAIKRDYSKSFSIDDMRWKIISDTELRCV